jgi:SpoVK/Ycf46/Vps4 family AAA+-type ATPase
MARAALIKKLFKSYKRGDSDDFMSAAWEVIDEERKKHHTVVANELTKIINSGSRGDGTTEEPHFHPLPKDRERDLPLFDRRRPDRYLSDLVLSENQEAVIKDVTREFTRWDILRSNGLQPVQKLLFCGPPGCGKTATAEAIATEIGLPLLYVRFDAVVSSLLGETAANLRKVFDYASEGSWVVLFDEFDAVGRSRDNPSEHSELKRVVNAFLQMIDSFEGRSLIIAATNFEQALDPAIWRRFDDILRFEKPDRDRMRTLVQKRLPSESWKQLNQSEFLSELDGCSYADAERVCIDARKQAALDGRRYPSQLDAQKALAKLERRKEALGKSAFEDHPTVDNN